nr:uncharacterized protein LOC128672624 isoform X1 [Plodia interpunctella]
MRQLVNGCCQRELVISFLIYFYMSHQSFELCLALTLSVLISCQSRKNPCEPCKAIHKCTPSTTACTTPSTTPSTTACTTTTESTTPSTTACTTTTTSTTKSTTACTTTTTSTTESTTACTNKSTTETTTETTTKSVVVTVDSTLDGIKRERYEFDSTTKKRLVIDIEDSDPDEETPTTVGIAITDDDTNRKKINVTQPQVALFPLYAVPYHWYPSYYYYPYWNLG